ncbi:hypothetical protein B0T22DRAFT_484442 [Podospora appendiculata]|uniref:Uncharacterized protein n=1 Tax=Podospora appendiculata TaxID=314037 RepID=A0AAE0X0V7_9PEZI|nr:hypothetical protein B0T22DRAFT_484442 [Podospora appendiculata]
MFKRNKSRKDSEVSPRAPEVDGDARQADRIGRFGQLIFERGHNWFGRRRRSSTLGSSRYRDPTPHPNFRLQGTKADKNEDANEEEDGNENDGEDDDDDDADANFTPYLSTDNTTPPTTKDDKKALSAVIQSQGEDDEDPYMEESTKDRYKFHPKYRDFVKKKGVMVVHPTVPLPEPSCAVFDRVEQWLDAQPDLSSGPDTAEDSDTSLCPPPPHPANYHGEQAGLQTGQYGYDDLRSKQQPAGYGSKEPIASTESALRHHAEPFPIFPVIIGTPEQSDGVPSRTPSPWAGQDNPHVLWVRNNSDRSYRNSPYPSQRWEPQSPGSPPLPHRVHGTSTLDQGHRQQDPTAGLFAPSIPPLQALAKLSLDPSVRCFSEPTGKAADSYELSRTASAQPSGETPISAGNEDDETAAAAARPCAVVPSIAESLAREGLGPYSRRRPVQIADTGHGGSDPGGRGLDASAASSLRKMIEDMEARNFF